MKETTVDVHARGRVRTLSSAQSRLKGSLSRGPSQRDVRASVHNKHTLSAPPPPYFCLPSPSNYLLASWSWVVMSFAVYDAITVSYRWAFWERPIVVDASVVPFLVLDALSDICFIANIAITLRTAISDNGAYVYDLDLIRRTYTRSRWFFLDVLSTLPLDLLQLVSLSVQPWTRCLKILRFLQVLHLIAVVEEDRTVTLFFRLSKLLFYTLSLSHAAACIKYQTLLVSYHDPEYTVLTTEGRQGFSKYLQNMYWALGSVTGRDDTSPPESFGDTAFTVLMMVVGVLWLAYIIASLEQFADSAGNANSLLQAKLKYATDFMHAFAIPLELQARVKSYYSYLFSSTLKYENDAFLSKLPSALQTDLRLAFAASVLDKADMFSGVESGFLCRIVQSLRILVTIPGEKICSLSEPSDRMYLIHDGEVEILIGPKLAQIATLRAGDYFGEYGLLQSLMSDKGRTRTSTARSTTYCTLFYLRYDELEEAMSMFPASRPIVLSKVSEHRKRTLQQEQNLSSLDGAGGKKNNKLTKLIQVEQTDVKQGHAARTIDPNGAFYRCWFVLLTTVTLYNAVVLSFRIGFLPDDASPALLFFDYLGDAIMLADIAVNFRLRYMEKGTEIRDVSLLAHRYLHSWLVPHILCSLPLDFAMVAVGMQPLLRMNKWLRVIDIHRQLLSKMKDTNHWEKLSLAYLLFNFVVISHFAACIYYAYTRFEGFGATFEDWRPPAELSESSAWYQYFYAHYYAMTLLAGIGRHTYPPSDYDVVLSLSLMLIGVFVVSYLITKVGHLICSLDAAAATYKNEYNFVQAMLEYRQVDNAIAFRVNDYLKHVWQKHKGIDPNLALNGLPSLLKTEIMLHICEGMIRSVPRFKTLDDSFIRALVSELTFVELPPGEWIFRQGQLGDSMYFISAGLAEILFESSTETRLSVASRVSVSTNENLKLKVIGAGSFFGEGALLREPGDSGVPTRSASVRAQSKCQLLSLSKLSFERVMTSHPRFARKIRQLNEDRKNKLVSFVHTKSLYAPIATPGWMQQRLSQAATMRSSALKAAAAAADAGAGEDEDEDEHSTRQSSNQSRQQSHLTLGTFVHPFGTQASLSPSVSLRNASVAPYPPPSGSHMSHSHIAPLPAPSASHAQAGSSSTFALRSELSLTTAAVFDAASQLSPTSTSRSSLTSAQKQQAAPFSPNFSVSTAPTHSTSATFAGYVAPLVPQQLRGVQRGSILHAMLVEEGEEDEEDDDELNDRQLQHSAGAAANDDSAARQPSQHSTPQRSPVLTAATTASAGIVPLTAAQLSPSVSSSTGTAATATAESPSGRSLPVASAAPSASSILSAPVAGSAAGHRASLVPQSALSASTPRVYLGTDDGGLGSARDRAGSAARRGKPLTFTAPQ